MDEIELGWIKLVQGWCEILYDIEGNVVEQKFVPNGAVHRIDGDDDPIEDNEIVEDIMSVEKSFPMDMIQPKQPEPEIQAPVKKCPQLTPISIEDKSGLMHKKKKNTT